MPATWYLVAMRVVLHVQLERLQPAVVLVGDGVNGRRKGLARPHHSAHRSTITGSVACSTSWSKLSAVTSLACSFLSLCWLSVRAQGPGLRAAQRRNQAIVWEPVSRTFSLVEIPVPLDLLRSDSVLAHQTPAQVGQRVHLAVVGLTGPALRSDCPRLEKSPTRQMPMWRL